MKENRKYVCGGIRPFTVTAYHLITDGPPRLNPEDHCHKECEIYINVSGDVSFMVEERLYPVSRGSVVITRPYEYHHCVYHSDAEPHEHFWILFSAEGNEDLLTSFFGRRLGEGNLLLLSPAKTEEMFSVCTRLCKEESTSIAALRDFLSLIALFEEASPGGSVVPISRASDVKAALRLMDAHIAEPITVTDLAAAASVSVNTLERHFKEAFGASPLTVLKRKRLSLSAGLLREGKSVIEACLTSGFGDYSHFIAAFRTHFGITPLQYKRMAEKPAADERK